MVTAADFTRVDLADEADFDGWRDAARGLAAAGVPPDQVIWQVDATTGDLFAATAIPPATAPVNFTVPKRFIDLAKSAICHSDRERFALLYQLLCLVRDNPHAMDDGAHPLVHRIDAMAKSVRRDIHKMRAFVRFRLIEGGGKDGGRDVYVAWFEPDHHIVRANAAFFVNRFASMAWSILTPELSIHWDGSTLHEGPGGKRGDAPSEDAIEDQWKRYYAAIFNPARVKIGAMLREMPRRYWKNMPETALIGSMIAGAQAREAAMIDRAPTAAPAQTSPASLWAALRGAAARCERCPLHGPATQTVFGEGPIDAAMMIVGEQPGDQEDLAGRAFVGPAGQVLDQALAAAGIDRAGVYVTNAVKHFKHELRGKRRLHQRPGIGEIDICRWWIDQERSIVRPSLIVALGATAARSLTGRSVTISRERGRALPLEDGGMLWITVHPSYLLRLPDAAAAEVERMRFIDDLAQAHLFLASLAGRKSMLAG